MLKKVYFAFGIGIELVLIFFLSGPVLEKTEKSHTLIFNRLQILFLLIFLISFGSVSEKYRKPIAVVLLFLYIVYLILLGRFLSVQWRQTIIDQNSF
jgi:Ca2+/Na+ antiporter